MGIQTERAHILANLKKPIGPLIGILCQFGFMPLCAFGLGMVFLSQRKYYNNLVIKMN